MIYFLLPSSPKYIFRNISIIQNAEEPTVVVSNSLCKYMNEIKEKIATRDKEWDVYKKFTNPYEYIHSIVPHKKRAVSKYKPISRSYFKMIEMIAAFRLDECDNLSKPLQKSASFSQGFTTRSPLTYDDESSTLLRRGALNNVVPFAILRDDSAPYAPLSASEKRSGFAPTPTSERRSLSLSRTIKRSKSDTFDTIAPRYELLVDDADYSDNRTHACALSENILEFNDAYYLRRETQPINRQEEQFTTRSPTSIVPFIQEFTTRSPIRASESIVPRIPENAPSMRTFHLAEGPGGFIEAICNKRANPLDEYIGMTILVDETDDNVPAWNKTGGFLSKYPNVHIETGADGTGNLLHIQNFDHCVNKYGSTMDLVTADGGFDFSKDFNKQEISILHLLWGQVCYALCLQKRGGNFVLKIFDIFYEHTVDILYILSGFYDAVNVCKLQTSRIGNSEKYVVCKGFRHDSNADFLSIIRDSFKQIELTAKTRLRYDKETAIIERYKLFSAPRMTRSEPFANRVSQGVLFVHKILNFSIPRHFTKHIEDINAMIGQQQIENIHYTISLIDKNGKCEKMDNLTRQNIMKCVHWCAEHNIPYNSMTTTSTNLFVDTLQPPPGFSPLYQPVPLQS